MEVQETRRYLYVKAYVTPRRLHRYRTGYQGGFLWRLGKQHSSFDRCAAGCEHREKHGGKKQKTLALPSGAGDFPGGAGADRRHHQEGKAQPVQKRAGNQLDNKAERSRVLCFVIETKNFNFMRERIPAKNNHMEVRLW